MRIATDRPDRLVIEHRPRSLMLLLAALAGVALALGIDLAWRGSLWAAVPLALGLLLAFVVHYDFPIHVTATFDRAAGTADLVWLDGAGVTRRTLPLEDIAGAEVEVIRSHDGPAITRAALVTATGRHQLTRAFMDGPSPARSVKALNDWLAR